MFQKYMEETSPIQDHTLHLAFLEEQNPYMGQPNEMWLQGPRTLPFLHRGV